MVIDEFSRIDVVAVVLVVRQIDGVVVKMIRQIRTATRQAQSGSRLRPVESKGGEVAESAARNNSNPGNRGRLVALDVASPDPKVGLNSRRRGRIGSGSTGSGSCRRRRRVECGAKLTSLPIVELEYY